MLFLTYKYGYVYKTTNLINGKIYIGQHKCNHFDPYYKGSGYRLHIAINKYGYYNFSVELIKWCSSPEELDDTEVFYILYYQSKDNDIGYNLTITKFMRGKTSKGKIGTKNHLGFKLNEQQKLRLSIAHKGQKAHNKGKRCYTNGNNILYLKEDEEIPEGYYLGGKKLNYKRPRQNRKYDHMKGRTCYNNGERNIWLKQDQIIPFGFYKGFIKHKLELTTQD